jgi:hypothetical protein
MQLIKRRWSEVEQEQVEGGGEGGVDVSNKPPLSPTSKLLRDAGGVVGEEGGGGEGNLAAELLSFVALPRLQKGGDCLLWWKIHEASLPMLAKILKEIFTIPASFSKSERVFSNGSKVCVYIVLCKNLFFVSKY